MGTESVTAGTVKRPELCSELHSSPVCAEFPSSGERNCSFHQKFRFSGKGHKALGQVNKIPANGSLYGNIFPLCDSALTALQGCCLPTDTPDLFCHDLTRSTAGRLNSAGLTVAVTFPSAPSPQVQWPEWLSWTQLQLSSASLRAQPLCHGPAPSPCKSPGPNLPRDGGQA